MRQIWRLRAYAPNGDEAGAVPTPTEYGFSVPLNDVSGSTMSYLDGAVGWDVLTQPCEIAAEYSVDDGLTWTEFPNGRYLRLGRSNDQLDPNQVRSYTLPGYGWLLSKMRQMKTTGLNADGKRMFNSANAGMIMKTLIDEAHSRGVCTGLGYAFTSSVDSAGNPWNKVLSIGYEPGLDLLTILQNLGQQGIVDWHFQGRVLHVFNADTTLAVDTQRAFEPAVDVKGLPVQGSLEDYMHSVLVLGDSGTRVTKNNVGVPEPWGKWEGFISQGGVSDAATMNILAQAALDDGSYERLQYTAELNVETTLYEPIVHYTMGSFILLPTESGQQSLRIRQLNFSRDGEGERSVGLIVNDKFLEKEIKNARRVNGITGGASSGGSGSPPAKDPAARQPKKPDGLVVDSVAIVNNGGGVDAWATMSYPGVEVDKDDVALEISGYRFQARQPVVNLIQENPSFESAYTGQTTGGATATISTAWASDGAQSLAVTPDGADNASIALPMGSGGVGGPGMLKMGIQAGKKYVLAVDIRLAAPQGGTLNANARRLGVGLRSSAGVNSYIYSAAAPNRAGVTTLKIPFQASVAGLPAQDVFVRFFNGSARAQDVVWFDNLRVYNDTQSPWDAWVSWGSSTGLTHSYGPLSPGVDWQVQMAAISAAGVPGSWSDSVTLTTASDVEPPAVPSVPVLTTRLGTLTVAWDGLNADGLAMPRDFERCLVHQLGVADPIGSIYSTRTPMVLTDVVIGDEYEFWFTALDRSGNESTASAHSSITVASIMDDPEAALDIQNGVTVASGGNFNTYSPNDPSGSGTKENDKWFKLDGGVTVGVWRWDGTAWVAETLANAVIANLDAGKITTGTLAAARIASGSISADKIAAGSISADKIAAGAIDGLVITGATIQTRAPGSPRISLYNESETEAFLTVGTRVIGSSVGQGWIFRASDGLANVLDSDSSQFLSINPTSKLFSIGSNTGSNGQVRFDSNGRMRLYKTDHSLFADFDASLGSQNARFVGAVMMDSLNVGNAATPTVYGTVASDSSNGLQLGTTGNRHILLMAGGSGQVRSPTIADDVLTHATTTGAMIRTDTGQLGIPGSARRFKVNIQSHEFEGDILSLDPKSWYDRREMETYVDMLDNIAAGIDPTPEEFQEKIDPMLQGHGLIAEEVEEAGFGEFVLKNEEGEIIALAYDRMWVALLPVVRALRDRVDDLEARLAR